MSTILTTDTQGLLIDLLPCHGMERVELFTIPIFHMTKWINLVDRNKMFTLCAHVAESHRQYRQTRRE